MQALQTTGLEFKMILNDKPKFSVGKSMVLYWQLEKNEERRWPANFADWGLASARLLAHKCRRSQCCHPVIASTNLIPASVAGALSIRFGRELVCSAPMGAQLEYWGQRKGAALGRVCRWTARHGEKNKKK